MTIRQMDKNDMNIYTSISLGIAIAGLFYRRIFPRKRSQGHSVQKTAKKMTITAGA